MTEHSLPGDGEGGRASGVASSVLNWAGAILSLALIVGLSVWGYRMAVREVAGVPVIRALEGPMRVAPEEPGGRQVAHQGLAVNRIAAEGSAAPPPDRIALAPRPLDIGETDRPMAVPVMPVAAALPPGPELPLPEDEGTATEALEEDDAPSGEPGNPALMAALAEALGAPAPAPAPAAETATPFLPPPGALARSVRPPPRPTGGAGPAARGAAGDAVVASAVAGAMASLGPRPAREVDPATLGPGTRLVQLGAYDDAAAARAAWDAVAARFGSLMDGRDRVLQQAESGGRAFVRLRVLGFQDEAEARRFCAALLAEETPCIPVLIR